MNDDYDYLFQAITEIETKYAISGTAQETKSMLSYPPPLEQKSTWRMCSMKSELGRIADERLRQAKATFNVALGLSIIGILIIILGVVLVYLQAIKTGILSSVVGALTEVIAVLLYKLNKDANDRLDDVRRDYEYANRLILAAEFVDNLPENVKKDFIRLATKKQPWGKS